VLVDRTIDPITVSVTRKGFNQLKGLNLGKRRIVFLSQ
jgi:hypothetical protein